VPLTILLVDDHRRTFDLFALIIGMSEHSDCRLAYAPDVETAAAYLETAQPDVILLDNRLPPYVNFEKPFEILRAKTKAPMILFTGSDLSDIGYDRLPEQFASFLAKTEMTPGNVSAVLAEALGQK